MSDSWLPGRAGNARYFDPFTSHFPLNARQQPLRFGQNQTQICDAAAIIGSVHLHDIRARLLAFSPGPHRPQRPGNASTPGQRTNTKTPNRPSHPQCRTPSVAPPVSHPQSCGSPLNAHCLGRSPGVRSTSSATFFWLGGMAAYSCPNVVARRCMFCACCAATAAML